MKLFKVWVGGNPTYYTVAAKTAQGAKKVVKENLPWYKTLLRDIVVNRDYFPEEYSLTTAGKDQLWAHADFVQS